MIRYKASAVGEGLVGKQARLLLPAFEADTSGLDVYDFREMLYLVQKHQRPHYELHPVVVNPGEG